MTYSPTVSDPNSVPTVYLSTMFALLWRVGGNVATLLNHALPTLQRNTASALVTPVSGAPRSFADEAIASVAYAINIDLTVAWQAVHANKAALGVPFIYGLPPSIGFALSPIPASLIDAIGAQLLLGQSQQIVGQSYWGSVAYIDAVRIAAKLAREIEVCKQASIGLTTPAQQAILAPLWASIERLYYTPGDAQTSLEELAMQRAGYPTA